MPKTFVITNPMIAANKSAEVTLSKFLRVISTKDAEIIVIGGNVTVESDLSDVRLISCRAVRAANKVKRVMDHLLLQLWMTVQVLVNINKGMPVYFWIGDKMLIPYAACKVKRANIHYFIYGNVAKEGQTRLFTRLSSRLISFMANFADYVCMESPSVIEEWNNAIANPNREIIHLYTEVGDFIPYDNRDKTIGMVCRIAPGKHIVESIDAFIKFHRQYPEWKLEIIGSGAQEQECRRLIEAYEAETLISMRGWVAHDDVLEIAKTWSLFLFPTDTEGMPNTLLEMMGAGVPPLASPVGGVKDVIVPNMNGWFLSGTSACDIEDALYRVVGDPNIAMIAKNAYRHICTRFTLQAAQNDYAEVIL